MRGKASRVTNSASTIWERTSIEVRCGKITDASVSSRDVICVSNEVLGKTMDIGMGGWFIFFLSIVISFLP